MARPLVFAISFIYLSTPTGQIHRKLENVFLRKNIVAVSVSQNCAIHPYS